MPWLPWGAPDGADAAAAADKSAKTSWLKNCRELPRNNNGRQMKLKQIGLPLHKGPGQLAKVGCCLTQYIPDARLMSHDPNQQRES